MCSGLGVVVRLKQPGRLGLGLNWLVGGTVSSHGRLLTTAQGHELLSSDDLDDAASLGCISDTSAEVVLKRAAKTGTSHPGIVDPRGVHGVGITMFTFIFCSETITLMYA